MSELRKLIKTILMDKPNTIHAINKSLDVYGYDKQEGALELAAMVNDGLLLKEEFDGSYLYSLSDKCRAENPVQPTQPEEKPTQEEFNFPQISNNISIKKSDVIENIKYAEKKRDAIRAIANEYDDADLQGNSVSLFLEHIAQDYQSIIDDVEG